MALCLVVYKTNFGYSFYFGNLIDHNSPMNNLTFETAKTLKDAGFPIPRVKVGQVWYNEMESPSVIVKNNGDEYSTGEHHYHGCSLLNGVVGNDFPESIVRERCYFAPTATDILKELGSNWNLSSFRLPSGNVEYAVVWNYECEEVADPDKEFYNDNPAEAAAMAWLHLRKPIKH